ncbi:TonB family protein [Thioalkalivibrio sp. ALMg11]|uniref:TonB family protein n=1 Tax=Thioalkalivibrio sp. ALMg11 TaxID=1158165 RepID=UPI0003614E91|nr:TonB family protein [Thioalkalivibrio sp. ALMg11]
MNKWSKLGLACALAVMAAPAAADSEAFTQEVGQVVHAHVAETAQHPAEGKSTRNPFYQYGLGTVTVMFTVSDSGKVEGALVDESSGYGYLDRAALEVVESMSGLPTPPETLSVAERTFRIPIEYNSSSQLSR